MWPADGDLLQGGPRPPARSRPRPRSERHSVRIQRPKDRAPSRGASKGSSTNCSSPFLRESYDEALEGCEPFGPSAPGPPIARGLGAEQQTSSRGLDFRQNSLRRPEVAKRRDLPFRLRRITANQVEHRTRFDGRNQPRPSMTKVAERRPRSSGAQQVCIEAAQAVF